MIIVTGCKRSGTSMWMQILDAAGFPPVGHAFPRDWGERALREANPKGFYESLFRHGIHHGTNPIPGTPHYVPPTGTERHAVKIFAPGFVRTHRAFIDRVVITMRPWRAYVRSRERLFALDETSRRERRPDADLPPRVFLDAALEWWMENVSLLRDVRMRRFDARWVSYAALLSDPATHVCEIVNWLGGDPDAAQDVVEPSLQTSADENAEEPAPGFAEVADRWHDAIAAGAPIEGAMLDAIRKRHLALRPRIERELAALRDARAQRRAAQEE